MGEEPFNFGNESIPTSSAVQHQKPGVQIRRIADPDEVRNQQVRCPAIDRSSQMDRESDGEPHRNDVHERQPGLVHPEKQGGPREVQEQLHHEDRDHEATLR